MDRRILLGVAGHIGAGKTTLAQFLSSECGFQYLRYSLVLAEWQKLGPASKSDLQELGWRVMSGNSQIELNRILIQQIDRRRDCVVDGLRHIIDYESLKREFAQNFALIFLNAPTEIRFERIGDRFVSYDDFLNADSHQVESNINGLLPFADLVLDGEKSAIEIAEKARTFAFSFREVLKQNL